MWVYKCLHESIGRDTNSETGKKTGTFKPGVKITVDKKKNGWLHHYKTKSWVSYYVPGTKTPAWVCENNGGSSSSSGSTTTTTGEGQIQQSIMSNVSSYKTSSSAPEWIVIHNTAGFDTAESVKTWFQGGAGGRHTGVQYVVDDKTAMQILPDESRPAHCGPRKSTTPAGSKGAGNENSLGIEICDGAKCNIEQSIDNGIEVCRYLMQKYNLGIDRVIKHEDVSGKKCPWYMISGTKGAYNHPPGDGQRWINFKNECESRNKQGLPFRFGGGGVTAGVEGSWGGVLPNFDNRENWEWTEKWDGVTITFLPPRNSCSVKDSEKYFAINKYDRTYNYVCDSGTFEEKLNPNYIAFSMDDNDRNTYIQNALWGSNKAIKNTVSIGVFIDPKSDDFEKMECKLIQNIGQIMYKLDMDANDLWREFDLNRAASPFMYLDRKKWKLFLDEVHKQLEWRRKKYGEHPKIVPTPVGPPPKLQEQIPSGGPAGYIANGVNIAAEFTSYCPFDGKDATSGGKNDCMGNPLSIGDKALASPHGKALYGTRAMIYGTGVPQLDGQIYTIRDTGSAIKPKSDLTWVVDILADTTEFANNVVGRIKNACLRIEKVPLEYPYKIRKSLPEDGGFNKPVTTLAEYDIMPIPEDPDSDDNIIDTDDENVNSETSGDRDIASPEHYFEIEEIEDDCPKPSVIITQAEFNELIELYSDSRMIDLYAMKNEPWDKDLEFIREAPVTEDDRLSAMSKKIETQNENTFHYNVVEASPGGSSAGSHSIQPSAELNILAKPDPVNVDPIYPDLTIIPNYATSEYNNFSQNRVPLYMMEESSVADDAAIEGQFSYDYSQLKDKKKESKGKPVNYYDPYVYDDRVHDLELHHPKVKIDEIELKLYECNHPGCPVSQPMAKSISAMAEAHITQSKKLEQRLVRMENTIAWLVRNFGRLGSRMNINCVYYGGQDIFGKYKTIRCLKDDRVQDGASVTIDQCLSCTRYEPVLGQIYDILDQNGMNGSAILDDMQMSYMDLNDMENLNSIHKRSSHPPYANVGTDGQDMYETLISKWKELDLEIYKKKLEKLKEERANELEKLNKEYKKEKEKLEEEENEKAELLGTNKNNSIRTTKASRKKEEDGESDINKEEEKENKDIEIITQLIESHQKPNMPLPFDKNLDEIKEEDYLFKMDWTPMDLNLQEPDIKPYPNEHIKSKFKLQTGDTGEEPNSEEKLDEDKENKSKIMTRDKTPEEDSNEESKPEDHKPWDPDMDFETDLKYDKETNEKLSKGEWVDTREIADTTELNKYSSEDFYYEGFNISRSGSGTSGMGGAECRQKIVEMALRIVEDHKNKKACYNMDYRTNDYNKPVIGYGNGLSNVPSYDCSSMVSCCYRHAGLTEVCDKNSDGIEEACRKTFKKRITTENISDAIPGDIIWRSGHVMIYTGNGEISHASGSSPHPTGIKTNSINGQLKKHTCYILRPADLIAADSKAANSSGGGANGGEPCSSVVTKSGKTLPCVWSFKQAVCTHYNDKGQPCADGTPPGPNVVGAHNIPYGTKVYIPVMDGFGGGGKAGGTDLGPKNNGVYKVADTGGPYYDFDVHSAAGHISKDNVDVYVLSWGTNTKAAWTFTKAIKGTKRWEQDAWNLFIQMGPKTLRFSQFYQEDLSLNISNPLQHR